MPMRLNQLLSSSHVASCPGTRPSGSAVSESARPSRTLAPRYGLVPTKRISKLGSSAPITAKYSSVKDFRAAKWGVIAMMSAHVMGWVTLASTAALIFAIDANASFTSLFSGRSSSKRMDPLAPFFLPTTENVPASCSAKRMYSPKGSSRFSLMMGSMNLMYCSCARLFSPPLTAGYPSSRLTGSTLSGGRLILRFSLTSTGAGVGSDGRLSRNPASAGEAEARPPTSATPAESARRRLTAAAEPSTSPDRAGCCARTATAPAPLWVRGLDGATLCRKVPTAEAAASDEAMACGGARGLWVSGSRGLWV
mmetsp:Transcript_30805/g.49535  ORF Transcript_30805/g.49535 Transcript_30805/m.49535 type:complete len:309 (-) Transcript_30805:101-1027(-)